MLMVLVLLLSTSTANPAASTYSCRFHITVTDAGTEALNGVYYDETSELSDESVYYYKWSSELDDWNYYFVQPTRPIADKIKKRSLQLKRSLQSKKRLEKNP